MQKPTSYLNFEIIKFLSNEQQLLQMLKQRDLHPKTFGTEIKCTYYQNNINDVRKSIYRVDFIYEVRDVNLEHNDDVYVLIEVTEGDPITFKIVNVGTY